MLDQNGGSDSLILVINEEAYKRKENFVKSLSKLFKF